MTKKNLLVASAFVVMLMVFFTGCPAEPEVSWPGNSAVMFTFEPNSTGLTLVNVNTTEAEGNIATSAHVSIPSEYEGKKVTAIGDGAFQRSFNLVGVSIPDTITSIGQAAFADCVYLREVHIPASVTSIGEYAFTDCANLETVTFTGTTTITTIEDYTFSSCPSLKRIISGDGQQIDIAIPASVTSIGKYAFYANMFAKITIPDTVLSVGDGAFVGEYLEEISLGKGFNNAKAFYGMPNLAKITVAAGNAFFKSVDDALLSADGEYLISVPAAKTTYTIPPTVSSIETNAFADSKITELNIPAKVAAISANLSLMEDLTKITVAAGNENYESDTQFALYSKDQIALVAYPADSAETAFVIPDTVTSISPNAFDSIPDVPSRLTSITLGKGITSRTLPYILFYNFSNLAEIKVVDANTTLHVVGGALVNADTAAAVTALYAFPPANAATSYAIPTSVTGISANAFTNNTKLTEVTFTPSGSVTLGSPVFAGCNKALKIEITVPQSSISGLQSTIKDWNPDGLKVTFTTRS